MWKIKRIIFYFIFSAITIVFALLGTVICFFPSLVRYKMITLWSRLTIFLLKNFLGIKYEVIGKDNIPKDAPYVVIANHQSTWETIFTPVLLPPQSWVVKKELLFIPFFGWGLALLKPITVQRNNIMSIKKVMEQGEERLKEGRCVLIYPEGTRLAPDAHKKFSKTGAALAINAKVPILPIAHNAGYLWPRASWIKKPGLIKVVIGTPVYLNGTEDKNVINAKIENWINTTKDSLKETD